MADWKAIEAEYITTETSYRKLAQKYGLNQATIAQRAKAEDWVGKRKQQASTTQAEIISAVEGEKVNRAVKMQQVADKLLLKVEELAEGPGGISAAGLKNLSETLRNLKDVQMIRSELDTQEQEARIANLRRQADREDKDTTIAVILDGEAKDYAN